MGEEAVGRTEVLRGSCERDGEEPGIFGCWMGTWVKQYEEVGGLECGCRAADAGRRSQCMGWKVRSVLGHGRRLFENIPYGFSQSFFWNGVNVFTSGFFLVCDQCDRFDETTVSRIGGRGSFSPSLRIRKLWCSSSCMGPRSSPFKIFVVYVRHGAGEESLTNLKHRLGQ